VELQSASGETGAQMLQRTMSMHHDMMLLGILDA
jgi:hypothetical protein